MKVEKNQIDALNLELTLQVEPGDYAEIERKKLAERRRTADFKGFRRGNVPESLIRRVYEVISSQLQKYIEDNKLNLLGEPLTSEKQGEVSWKDGEAFTFIFDLAIRPEVKLSAGKEDSIPSYKITVSAKEKEDMKKNLKKYYEDKKDEKKSDEEIEKEVSERLEGQYAQEAEWRLTRDIREHFVDKAAVALPEDFLKRWLFVANGGKVSKEDIEKDFAGFLADFRWSAAPL